MSHTLPAVDPALTDRIRTLRDLLLTGLVERDVPIRLALLAALAGEHLLLVGPPGTGKSLVARRLGLMVAGAVTFERLLTRFTVPEELFGPLSIKGLTEDRYERLTDGFLPSASFAFLDEIFKANSAILNALLTLLNEREFDNGKVRAKVPLLTVIGASNELPEGEELDALHDRFLLRAEVGPVSSAGFGALLALRGGASPKVSSDQTLSVDKLSQVQDAAQRVIVPDAIVALLRELRLWCTAESIAVSDRRWRKIVHLVQVSALTNGRSHVSIWDLWILQHCIGDTQAERERVHAWYAEHVGAAVPSDASQVTKLVTVLEAQLELDRSGRSQKRNASGELLFDVDGNEVTTPRVSAQKHRGKSPLYLAPDRACADYYMGSVVDRKNGQKGYTIDELDALYVRHHERFSGWEGRGAYLAERSNWIMENAEAPPAMEPTRHAATYIDTFGEQVQTVASQVKEYLGGLDRQLASMDQEVRSHLWVTSDFAEPAKRSLEQTRSTVQGLLNRLESLRVGVSQLPRLRTPTAVSPIPPKSGKASR